MLIAHMREGGQTEQLLTDHSRNVAALCAEACAGVGLEKLGYLTGLLHDLGKASSSVQERIRGETDKRFNHSSAGMRWIMDKVHGLPASAHLAAQMAALSIGCHHGGRCDVVSPLGKELWID